MAYKYQTFADLLYASYSGLQALGFAFAKGKQRYDRECYAFRESVIKRLKARERKISDLYQNIIRQLTSPHDTCSYDSRESAEAQFPLRKELEMAQQQVHQKPGPDLPLDRVRVEESEVRVRPVGDEDVPVSEVCRHGRRPFGVVMSGVFAGTDTVQARKPAKLKVKLSELRRKKICEQ